VILVAGTGNVFQTDDGFGPAVVARLSSATDPMPESVRVVDYGIRGMHLAYDLLEEWDALVLVDALPDHGEPGRVDVLEIGASDVASGGQVDAHGMDPATVLATLAALGGTLPPRTVLVGCQVSDTDEGMGLTPVVDAAIDQAVRHVQRQLDGLLAGAPAATEVR